MTHEALSRLTPLQRRAMVVAMVVRNTLEDFHVVHLSNIQMKELNRLIRYGIYDALSLIEIEGDDKRKQFALSYLIGMIPDYWEVPGSDPNPNPENTHLTL